MRYAKLILLIAWAAHAQSSNSPNSPNSPWIGVWHGELGGQPSVTLTLAEDTGELGGTVVLNMVSREGGSAHVIGSATHLVVHPRLAGNTLSFQVTRASDAKRLEMEVVKLDSDRLTIRCVNCGGDSTAAELVKSRP